MGARTAILLLLLLAVGGFLAFLTLSGEEPVDAAVAAPDAGLVAERRTVAPETELAAPPEPEEAPGAGAAEGGAPGGAAPPPPEPTVATRPPAPPPTRPPPPPPPPAEAPPTGALAGRVVLAGEPPPPRPPLAVDPACCDAPDAADRGLLVGAGGGIADAVVEIGTGVAEAGDAGGAEREAAVAIECCRFERHVAAVPAGGRLVLENRDERPHPVRALGRTPFEPRELGPGEQAVVELPLPDRLELRDDAHPWMQAWVVVSASPHAAVTGADGGFHVDGLPVGSWSLSVWHAELGGASETVEILPGETTEVVIELGR